MSAFGIPGLTKTTGGLYKVEQSGFATYDKKYSGILDGPIPILQGDIAEEWPNTVLLSYSILETGVQCSHVELALHYEGKDDGFTNPLTSQDISIDFTTSQEPIESHIDFVSDIGGTPDSPKHGAIFDANTGEFLGFPVVDPDEPLEEPSRFAGLRSYLQPQETFVSNSVEFDYPTATQIAQIGQVFDPETEYGLVLPALPGERSWLNTGVRVQNIANVYFRRQLTGMLSGPRNWIPEIYGEL